MTKKKEQKLTKKQELFCIEYLKSFNGSRAAIAAGYSKKSAEVIASENLRKPYIQQRIQSESDKIMKTTGSTVEMVILELMLIAHGDYKDFVEWNEDGIKSWVPSKELGDKTRMVQEIKETMSMSGGSKSLKLYDKMKALEMLGRYHKIFTDKIDINNPDGNLKTTVIIGLPSNGRENS